MIRILAAFLALTACEKKREASTLGDVYAQLATAIGEGDAQGIFDSLDLRSRWAAMSIYKSERDIHRLAATRYSAGPREREMARYRTAAESENAAAFLAREFSDRIAALEPQLAPDPRLEHAQDGKSATVVTASGARLSFARGDDGRWGWTDLKAELEAREKWSANALQTVREGTSRRGN